MFHIAFSLLAAFGLCGAYFFTFTNASGEPRKDLHSVVDLIRDDAQALSKALDRLKKKQKFLVFFDLVKKYVVRRCNAELQSMFLKSTTEYDRSLASTANHLNIFLQETDTWLLLFRKHVDNAEWSEALGIFRTLDDLYSTANAQINSCYTHFKMIFDVNNGFYGKNEGWGSKAVQFLALGMNEKQCQAKKSVLFNGVAFFAVVAIICSALHFAEHRISNRPGSAQQQQPQRHPDPHLHKWYGYVTIDSLISCLLFAVFYFICLLSQPEDVSCAAELSSTVESHHNIYIDEMQSAQSNIGSNIAIIISDVSYLALLSRTEIADQLEDSIWKSLAFDANRIVEVFEANVKLEYEITDHLNELEKHISKETNILQLVHSNSLQIMEKMKKLYAIMNLHLRGHQDTLPGLDKIAEILVESVLVGRDELNYNRLNGQYTEIIKHQKSDLDEVINLIQPLLTQTGDVLKNINQGLDDADKQKKSVITRAAIAAHLFLGLASMVIGVLMAGGGVATFMKGDQIEIDATDLFKVLKSMDASLNQIMTLTNDQYNYLLEMQRYWNAQERNLKSFHDIATSNLQTTIKPISKEDIQTLQNIQHKIINKNRDTSQAIKNVLSIIPSLRQQKEKYTDG
ncbi:unnamed protein product [Adineta ricciae]|uniref:Uncharacterized protein n=1 Tax=Adineta ricciae TaxID=249248 RepID=A0A814BI15_ADIRI|nr:unnamed protein product [Adineta ricciae]CAF1283123.1 unnamed protein product [Adineta ricciae]